MRQSSSEHIKAFSDPNLSLFQSAVEKVAGQTKRGAGGFERITVSDRPEVNEAHVAAVVEFANALESMILEKQGSSDPAALVETLPISVPSEKEGGEERIGAKEVIGSFAGGAKLAFQYAQAFLNGNKDRAEQLHDILKFNTVDPLWLEAAEQYISYFVLADKPIPYRRWTALSDFVLEDALPERATIGFIADWGTGTQAARKVLQQIRAFQPDIVIHLGDIYYAGTEDEADDFYRVCNSILDLQRTRLLTLAGNHDMYSGGEPYYRLLDKLGQPASYFCLRNRHWQFLGMDTGLHDHNPNVLRAIMTFLEPAETEWHRDKILNAEERKTVLLSHHQLFTACSDIANGSVNPRLKADFEDLLPQVALWLWGHEHNLVQYGTYLGLQRGRCIGCGAIPVFTNLEPYHVTFPEVPILTPRLNHDGQIYSHGYAVMKLDGPRGTVDYYQDTQPDVPLWTDEF